jgi:hypothetical protein
MSVFCEPQFPARYRGCSIDLRSHGLRHRLVDTVGGILFRAIGIEPTSEVWEGIGEVARFQ